MDHSDPLQRIMKRFHTFLTWLGIPKHLFSDYKVHQVCISYCSSSSPPTHTSYLSPRFAKLSLSSLLSSELPENGKHFLLLCY